MTIITISAVITWFIFVILSALVDYWIVEVEKMEISDEGHIMRTIIRGLAGIVCASMGGYGFEYGVLFMFFEAASFWLIFDALLNILRKKPILYVGYTSKIDVYFRYHFPFMAEKAMISFKGFILFLSIIFLILI